MFKKYYRQEKKSFKNKNVEHESNNILETECKGTSFLVLTHLVKFILNVNVNNAKVERSFKTLCSISEFFSKINEEIEEKYMSIIEKMDQIRGMLLIWF